MKSKIRFHPCEAPPETFSRAKTAAQKKQLLNVILQDVQRT
jgi:hypothetical protein